MIKCSFNEKDLTYMFLEGPESELKRLTDHFNKIPDYQFLPSFQGIPKPEVFINNCIVNFKKIYNT